ncbi:hypothetical protein [Nonomuraea sp. NPDC023979]|uniref:hypothetical protein n=1 Tax=Nonomuraea sp. NPDC023979 TaxID=3154796 RepID=UPI00340DE9D2
MRSDHLSEEDVEQIAADFAALLRSSAAMAAQAHGIALSLEINTVVTKTRTVIPLQTEPSTSV